MGTANVVRDFCIGNTRIRIADDYCMRTQEEVDAALKRISENAQRQIEAAARKESHAKT